MALYNYLSPVKFSIFSKRSGGDAQKAAKCRLHCARSRCTAAALHGGANEHSAVLFSVTLTLEGMEWISTKNISAKNFRTWKKDCVHVLVLI